MDPVTELPHTVNRGADDPAPLVAPALASYNHRTTDGRFRNPWPDAAPHGFGDFVRWRRARASLPDPTPSALRRATPQFVSPHAEPAACSATWVGHSTVLLQIGGLNVLTDPIWSNRASPVQWVGPRRQQPPGIALAALPPIDIVLVSHNHYDHLDARTVRALARLQPTARWCVPQGLAATVRRWGVRVTTELDWWGEADVAGARVACTPAQHFSARSLTDRMRTLWCGWSLRAGTRSVFYAGDTAYHPEFGAIAQRYGPFDLCLLPIGAYEPRWFMRTVHMNPDDVVRAYLDLARAHPDVAPPIALGIHWGTFKLTDEPMDDPPRRTLAAWRDAGLDETDLWLLATGETRGW